MTEFDDDITLRQILEFARVAHGYADGIDEQTFLEDEMRYHASTRLLSLMGEGATRLSQAKRDELESIPWRQIIAFRNILMHLYHRIDNAAVWHVLTNDLPSLISHLDKLNLPEEAE